MKSYKIDTTQYTEEQITLLATHYGYQATVYDEARVQINNPQTEIEYIELMFKQMADDWFARPLISQVDIALRVARQDQIATINNLISASTIVETI